MKRRAAAFTLVELLVVIGIISVLIAILLPTLSAAKRQAQSTKCLSNLRQIGLALLLYEKDHRGAWPVAIHQEGSGPPFYPSGHGDRVWQDFLAPYILSKKFIETKKDLEEIRDAYDKFACPAFDRTTDADPFYFGNPLGPTALIGYAMQYHPTFYDILYKKLPPPAGIDPGSFFKEMSIVVRDGAQGTYVKGDKWRKRASERGVIADADGILIFTIDRFMTNVSAGQLVLVNYQPYIPRTSDGAFNPSKNFLVNALRHAKPFPKTRLPTPATMKVRGMNLLFADGHASPVSVTEAFNAIHNPGMDRVGKPSAFGQYN